MLAIVMNTFRNQYPRRTQYKSSVYYLWFEFLKRSDPKDWSKKVRDDFGDILNVEFMDWWEEKGRYLFYTRPEIAVLGVSSAESAQEAIKNGWLVVRIDKRLPKQLIMEQLKRYIDNRVDSKVGSRKFKAEKGADYIVASKVDTNALINTLAVYDLAQKEPSLLRWKIEERLRLIDKTTNKAGALWKMGNTPKELAAKKKVQTATVSRYLRQANELIANVAKGKFPVHGK